MLQPAGDEHRQAGIGPSYAPQLLGICLQQPVQVIADEGRCLTAQPLSIWKEWQEALHDVKTNLE